MVKNPTNSPRIRLNFQAKLYFSKRGKVASAILYSLIKHAEISQSQSLVELFKNFDGLTRRQLSITTRLLSFQRRVGIKEKNDALKFVF